MQPLSVTAFTASCAAGSGNDELLASLRERRSGLTPNDFGRDPLPTWIGRVAGIEQQPLPDRFAAYDCRNNRLAWRGIERDSFCESVDRARRQYGAGRVALVLGTSTSSIGATEEAYSRLTPEQQFPEDLRRQVVHTPHSTGEFLGKALELEGAIVTVATACSSSAKAFAQGERLIRLDLADAVVVAGVDSLCDSVLFGFNSLALVSPEPCRPFDARRTGISIGEAAAFALLERTGTGPRLLGFGESSDAHHMSSPHPSGRGARLAIQAALDMAQIATAEIDYVNLHGTASLRNDEIEAQVLAEMFPVSTRASSTKGWTGHTLGAAGALEAVISLLTLQSGLTPGNLNTRELDPLCGPQVRLENVEGRVRRVMSNSFGFGGSNCVLIFGAES